MKSAHLAIVTLLTLGFLAFGVAGLCLMRNAGSTVRVSADGQRCSITRSAPFSVCLYSSSTDPVPLAEVQAERGLFVWKISLAIDAVGEHYAIVDLSHNHLQIFQLQGSGIEFGFFGAPGARRIFESARYSLLKDEMVCYEVVPEQDG